MMEYVKKRIIAVPRERFSSSAKIHCLAAAECPAFFTADVVQIGDSVHLCYSTGDFRPLSQYSSLDAEQIFTVVKKVLLHVDAARDWMWFPEEYVISADTVWMNSNGQVRILCIPEDSEVSYPYRLRCFLHNLKRLSEPAVSSCLQVLQNMIADGTMRTEQLISEIDQMTAEVQSYF